MDVTGGGESGSIACGEVRPSDSLQIQKQRIPRVVWWVGGCPQVEVKSFGARG